MNPADTSIPDDNVNGDDRADAFAQQLRQAVALPDAPPALLRAAIDLWSTRTGPAVTVAAAMRRLRAVLSFDSAVAAPGLMAARSGGGVTTAPRHMLFSVDGRDIDLRVHAVGDSHTLAGQVLGPDEEGRIDLLLADSDLPIATTELNAMGEFRLDGVAPGRYELLLQLGEEAIALPAIDVGNSDTSGT